MPGDADLIEVTVLVLGSILITFGGVTVSPDNALQKRGNGWGYNSVLELLPSVHR